MSRSQTATEYLVILALILVIALIVVSILGGIPSIGGSVDRNIDDSNIITGSPIQITGHAISDYDTILIFQNVGLDLLRINSVALNGENCLELASFTLSAGRSRQITCINVFSTQTSSSDFLLEINYTNEKTDAAYELDELYINAQRIATKYLDILDNTASYSFANAGCWNFTDPDTVTSLCTCADLSKIGTNESTVNGTYELMNNVDFVRCKNVFGSSYDYTTGEGWTPIGNSTLAWRFKGAIDGNDNYIKNLFINRPSGFEQGFVSYTEGGAPNFTDIGFVSASVTGNWASGVIVGYGMSSTFTNAYVTGTVTSSSDDIGLIVGRGRSADFYDVYAIGSVTGVDQVGGLTGYARNSNINNSYTNVFVNGDNYVGGLVGYGSNADVVNSYSLGDVTGSGDSVGGLTGMVCSPTDFTDSYASGDVSGVSRVGGIMGYICGGSGHDYEDVSFTGSVYCDTEYCGYIIGRNVSSGAGVIFTGDVTFTDESGDNATSCIGDVSTVSNGTNYTLCDGP